MGTERPSRVQCDPEELWIVGLRNDFAINGDGRESAVLSVPGREESGRRLDS